MDKKYILVARDNYNNTSIIEVKSEYTNEYEKMTSLLEIDKMTTKYFNSLSDFKKRVKNGKYENCDIYIVHKKRNKEEEKLNFRDLIFQNTGADINHFLNNTDSKGKISLNDSYLSKYVGELIYRLKKEPSYKQYMDKIFPHLTRYFNLAITNQLNLDTIEYLNFLKRLSNYLEIRKIIMATKQYDNKLNNYYQERLSAKYPLFIFISDNLKNYQRNDLSSLFNLEEFINYKSLLKKNDNNYVEGQLELEDLKDNDLEFIDNEELSQMTGTDEFGNLNNLHKLK